jgi:molybdate-binding protein
VHLAVRTQGLFVAPGNPLGIRGLDDLKRRDLRFVNRPEGSGTRVLTELLLKRHGIAARQVSGFENTELTHAAVAAFVASGMADVGMGVQTAAHRFGLHFIPLLKERYFFALPTEALARAEIQPVLAVLQSPAFVSRVAALKGYEAAGTGQVLSLADAFPA